MKKYVRTTSTISLCFTSTIFLSLFLGISGGLLAANDTQYDSENNSIKHSQGEKQNDSIAQGRSSHDDHEKGGHNEEGEEKSGHDDHEKSGHDDHEKGGHDDHEKGGHEEEEEEDSVKLTQEQIESFDIKTSIATSGYLKNTVTLPGEIVLNADKTVHFFPRYRGVVKKINKVIGDNINKGDVLAVIESNSSFQNYSVRSQVSGTIVERHVSLGEVVETSDLIFVVTDLRTVWVNLSAYQQNIDSLHKNQEVTISSFSTKKKSLATINYISPIFDEKTRTARVQVHLNNDQRQWRPGAFITGEIVISKKKSNLIIKRSAIQTVKNKTSIFVVDGTTFRATPVKLGQQDANFVEVIQGLSTNTPYVSEGSFTLKSDLEKSQFGDGHNH